MSDENLIGYIRIVRKYTKIPITTSDDYNFWNKEVSKKISSETDFISCHIYPLWNGKKLNEAFSWLNTNLSIIRKIHKNRLIVIGEIGWATAYNADKKGDGQQGTLIKGKVDVETQGRFLIEFDKWVEKEKILTFLFEAFDEPWKGGGENTGKNEIEKNWGLFYENRKPKHSFVNYLNYLNNGGKK